MDGGTNPGDTGSRWPAACESAGVQLLCQPERVIGVICVRETEVRCAVPPATKEAQMSWQETYLDRFYGSQWHVDGTTEFHAMCAAHIPSGATILEIGAGP